MKYTGPKVRVARKINLPLTPKAERVMQKKAYPPGQQGGQRRRGGKESVYKRQLVEKQRLRSIYNIHERQMRICYRNAVRAQANTAEAMIGMLETRLDALVAHGGLARTIYAARQYVNHGHILVNGKRVDIPSYRAKVGDVIAVQEKSRKMECFAKALEGAGVQPPYIELNRQDMSIRLLNVPKQEEIPLVDRVGMSLIVEFYSR